MKKVSTIIKNIIPYKFKFDKKNYGILISDRLRVDHNFRSILSGLVINKNFNANAFVLSEKKLFNNETNDLFNFFNIKKLYGNVKIFSFNNVVIYFNAFQKIIFCYLKILNKKDKLNYFIKNFKVLDVHIGDAVYDDYTRHNHLYLNPSIFSLKFIYFLYAAIYKILIIEKEKKINKIKFFITNQKAYSSMGNLMLRYGTKKKIITFLTGANFIQYINSYKETLGYVFKIKDELVNTTKKKISKNLINKYHHDRFSNKICGLFVDKKTLKKIYQSKNEKNTLSFIKKLKGYRSINLFAAHCFSDAPHTFSKLVFRDYYDQFVSTIKFLKKIENNKDLWIIKAHPERKNYDEEGIIEKVLSKYNVSNVIICPKNINNNILYKNVDNLVTTGSTIALEFSCIGKKPIITGEAAYYDKEICTLVKNKKEYFNLLRNISEYKNKMNKNQILKSKYMLYILDNLIVNNLPMSKILPSNTKYSNNSLSYLKTINKNRTVNKIQSIFDDLFYKQLERKIKQRLSNKFN